MVMPRTQSLITFPVEIQNPGTTDALQEMHWLAFSCQLLETKLLQLMRFKFGEVCLRPHFQSQSFIGLHIKEGNTHFDSSMHISLGDGGQ